MSAVVAVVATFAIVTIVWQLDRAVQRPIHPYVFAYWVPILTMPRRHGYEIVRDSSDMVVYSKTHNNGEQTTVQLDKVGTKAAGGTSWLVNVSDPNGSRRIGKFDTKSSARQAATRWMNNHPKGVHGVGGDSGHGVLDSMQSGVDGVFTGGGRFR